MGARRSIVLLGLLAAAGVGFQCLVGEGVGGGLPQPAGTTATGVEVRTGQTVESDAAIPSSPFADRGRVEIRVLAAEDGQPLPGSRIMAWRPTGGVAGAFIADEDGVARIDSGSRLLLVSAAGRATVLALASRREISLERTGSIEVRVTDGAGGTLVGVPVLLVPPGGRPAGGAAWQNRVRNDPARGRRQRLAARAASGAGAPAALVAAVTRDLAAPGSVALGPAVLDRSSDAHGRVAWERVPPGPGWRWGLPGPGRTHVEPPYESSPYTSVSGGIRVRGEAPQGLSGPFAVEAGGRRILTGVLERSGAILGRLDADPGIVREPWVVLASLETVQLGDGTRIAEIGTEAAGAPDREGCFRFGDLAPGDKLVTARWRDPEGTYCVASAACSLGPGEERDLGWIGPGPGQAVEVALVLTDGNGVELTAEGVFGTGPAPLARVMLLGDEEAAGLPDSPLAPEVVLMVPLGGAVRVRGLAPGRWRAIADRGDAPLPLEPLELSGLPSRRATAFVLPGTPRVALPVAVGTRATLGVLLTAPGAERELRARITLETAHGRRATRELLIPAGGLARAELSAPPGPCRVWAGVTGEGDGAAGWYGETRLQIGHGPTADTALALWPAAGLTGRVVSAGVGGRPDALLLREQVGSGHQPRGWTWAVPLEPDGSFRVAGLPPRAVLEGRGLRETVTLGSAGTVQEVILHRDDP